jgi:hypothetical protein
MLCDCFLKEGIVYVPTVVKLRTGAYMDVEPVAAIPVGDTNALRRAFVAAIARVNAIVPNQPKDDWPPPVLLKYTGDKNWSAFKRGASHWDIQDKAGSYQIVGHRTHRKGYWEPDPDQKIEFPPGTTVDHVVDRMIAILQEAAR